VGEEKRNRGEGTVGQPKVPIFSASSLLQWPKVDVGEEHGRIANAQ